jgi:transposase
VSFLEKIAIEYAGQEISIILDNASYQRCKAVQAVAAELGIELVFLPPYSPNQNKNKNKININKDIQLQA